MGSKLLPRDHLGFLAELTASFEAAAARPGLSAEERGRYARWSEKAHTLEALLTARKTELQTVPAAPAEDDDLPPALLRELKGRGGDDLERQILAVLAAGGGTADLDQVLIGLYRGFGIIQKRRVLQNKLWRLVRTGRIAKAKDRRNVFSLNTSVEDSRRSKRKKRSR